MASKRTLIGTAAGCACSLILALRQPLFLVAALLFLAGLVGFSLKLLQLSETDPLTGLYNLRHLERMRRSYAKSRQLTVFYFDLDHLKQINDTQGHSRGDQVLQQMAQLLKETGADAYRLGGDEFLLVSASSDASALLSLWDQANISASWGMARGPGSTLSDLMVKAEQQMYQNRKK